MIELRLQLSRADARALQVLGVRRGKNGADQSLHEVAGELITRALEAVRRPGAWERAVFVQLFGVEWPGELEADPDRRGYLRPKRRRPGGA